MLAVNLDGAFLGLRHAIPLMQLSGGAIVNVTSASGVRAAAGAAAYSTSKAALAMLTARGGQGVSRQRLAYSRERGRPGRRENADVERHAVLPGPGDDPRFRGRGLRGDGSRDAQAARFSSPSDIASAVLFLASDDARQITGVELVVDAGYVL